MKPDNEKALVEEFVRGSHTAFKTLVKAYEKELYSFVFRLCNCKEDAEDMYQETFLRLWQYRASCSAEKPIRPYLYEIAKKAIYRKSAKDKRYGEVVQHAATVNPKTDVSAIENTEMLREALHELPEPEKSVLVLLKYQNLSYREVAQVMEMKERSVEYRLQNALEMLRVKLAT